MNSKSSNRLTMRSCLAAAIIAGALSVSSCSDDVLTGQPSWLGESIYEELQRQGNYTTLLHLIDDLGLTEQMSHTGSLTLFAADDETFTNWFNTNSWGVRKYSDLSLAQKKMLLYSEEINNAYLVELLSNVSADPPLTGRAMRRPNSSSIFDSITTMRWQDMPNTEAWQYYRNNHKDIILFKDGRMESGTNTSNLSQPMIHFLPAFMEYNNFTDEDITILTNGRVTSTKDSYVGGFKITEPDITCKNGYIHKMDGVIEPFQNMAEIIRRHANTSQWSHLLDRYCAPYYDRNKTNQYNSLYPDHRVDSVFTLRYFADRRNDNLTTQSLPPTTEFPDGKSVSARLPYDPGWNQYMYENTSDYDLHYDCAAMLVPTNEALDRWWNNDGRVLQDMYGTWDNVPDLVLSKLIGVNMLSSFVDFIPSKFSAILNDAKTEMGVKISDVDSTFVGCNGVVYLTNKVFTPMEYSSVTFPALIHQDIMSCIYQAIDNYSFLPYLNSMDSYYSLILPTNNAVLYYIDPCNYGDTQRSLIKFSYDTTTSTLKGERYACDIDDDGNITVGTRLQQNVGSSTIQNRFNDLINQMIIVGNVEDGYMYYKTKNGTPVRVDNAGKSNMSFSGGWQIEHNNHKVMIDQIYDESTNGNGKSYVVNEEIPQSASKSVYQTLQSHPEYSEFLKLLQGSENMPSSDNILVSSQTLNNQTYNCSNPNENANISLFGNYNYNVYVPTNESIKDLEQKGYLPTWEDYDAAFEAAGLQEDTICKIIKNRILDFVKYHIQDNAVLIDMAPETDSDGSLMTSNNYSSMMLNPATNRYFPIHVDFSKTDMSVTDNIGNVRHVVKTNGLYNNICREYWISGSGYTKSLYASADAVVQLIDGPLYYNKSQQTSWRTLAKKFQHRKK